MCRMVGQLLSNPMLVACCHLPSCSDARDVVYRDAKLAEVRRRVRAVTRRWEQAGKRRGRTFEGSGREQPESRMLALCISSGKALAIEDHEHVLSYYVGRNGRDEGSESCTAFFCIRGRTA